MYSRKVATLEQPPRLSLLRESDPSLGEVVSIHDGQSFGNSPSKQKMVYAFFTNALWEKFRTPFGYLTAEQIPDE